MEERKKLLPRFDSVQNTLVEIAVEVNRQIKLWGFEFDNKNTANDWVAYITRYAADGAYDGREHKYNKEYFRRALIKTAALCVAAILAIDRGGPAPRHYDK